jgi:predicted ester cyclase
MEGDFVREFTQSPVGPLPPNGQHVVFELTNIFRYDDEGRILDEWVQIDNHTLLQQLGGAGS